jgi:tRNA-splicing ligase RtcB
MEIKDGIAVFGGFDDIEEGNHYLNSQVFQQMLACINPTAVEGARGALMADKHLGYRMPIGGVVAYEGFVSPTGVGYDIGCGNYAVKTDLSLNDIYEDHDRLAAAIREHVHFGIGTISSLGQGVIDELPIDWTNPLMKPLRQLAANQLGTVGGGNHYVDILFDLEYNVWVACHFGSRGFGHKITKAVMEQTGFKDSMMGEPLLIRDTSILGEDYIQAMKSAGDYAYVGRRLVVHHVVKEVLGAKILDSVENHHNFAWKEEVDGRIMWVIRKGATPANRGRMFIGNSMGGASAIVTGQSGPSMQAALNSAPHGSGRLISRGKAKKSITPEMMKSQTKYTFVYGGDVDEAPAAYRELHDVLAQHDYLKVEQWLQPFMVLMAGKQDGQDPYKD